MDDRLKRFLDSSILEEYALGLTDDVQNQEVELYLKEYQEVREAYQKIQLGLENLAKINAIKPPAELRSKILNQIGSSDPAPGGTEKSLNTFSILSGIAAAVLLMLSLFAWNNLNNTKSDLQDVNNQLVQLKSDCDEQAAILNRFQEQLEMINNPNTERVYLAGNENAPEFKTYAYWNKATKQSLINVVEMPTLSNKQCYQMWADVDGEMISLGVINAEKGILADLPFLENAESLNITIEKEGGSDHPDVSKLVASQTLI
jgi:anti-sigma-K factor RskA